MARRNKRASMREGPLADLFRSTADDSPADPPEAPRYGREDPAEAQKAEAAGDTAGAPAGEAEEAPLEQPRAAEPTLESEPAAPGAGTEAAPFFDQDEELPGEEQPASSSETAPERLKRVFSEEPKPQRHDREDYLPGSPR